MSGIERRVPKWKPIPDYPGYFVDKKGNIGSGRIQQSGEILDHPVRTLKPIRGRVVDLIKLDGTRKKRSPRQITFEVWGVDISPSGRGNKPLTQRGNQK